MATHKLKLYPSIALDKGGRFLHVAADTYRYCEKGEEAGHISKESGSVFVNLPPIDISFDYPEDVRAQALAILRANRTKLQGEHIATMTRFQYLENQLLGLAAPDVLDADDNAGRNARSLNSEELEERAFGDDLDTPF